MFCPMKSTLCHRDRGGSLGGTTLLRRRHGRLRVSVQGGWVNRVMIGSPIFGRIDMSTRIVSASLALACVLGSPSALAWKNVDGVIKFESN